MKSTTPLTAKWRPLCPRFQTVHIHVPSRGILLMRVEEGGGVIGQRGEEDLGQGQGSGEGEGRGSVVSMALCVFSMSMVMD